MSCSPSKDQQIPERENTISPVTEKSEIKSEFGPADNYKKITKMEVPKFTKGLYLNAYTVATDKFHSILDSAEVSGINTIIFDLKNMNGHIFFSIPQKDTIRQKKILPIIKIPEVVKTIHHREMRAVARIVMFHDQFLAEKDTLLRPTTRKGKVWQESKKKAAWLDPSNPVVQKELLNIIEMAARNGVDEIQMDYVRFPTQGKLSDAVFYFQTEDSTKAVLDSNYVFREKYNIIENFINKARTISRKFDVNLTADVFAIVAWQNRNDIKNTGQDIARMTKHLDAIHPMIYSSHFADNFGYRKNVPNEPYHVVYSGTSRAQKYSRCKVIPYIQANDWKVNYGQEYIYAQIKAVENTSSDGYILWNASNKYYKTLSWIRQYSD